MAATVSGLSLAELLRDITHRTAEVFDLGKLDSELRESANRTFCLEAANATRENHDGYEVVNIPTSVAEPYEEGEKLVPVSTLPKFAHAAFEGYQSLNRVQSRLAKIAFETDENILLSAPTGSGKTNVALLCILREMGKHLNTETNIINVDGFKVIYVAPMKALVQEMVENFRKRLSSYHIKVDELTGEHQLKKQEIQATQIIVCTPEKWDVITRKGAEREYAHVVHLIIFDEVHLLHESRGPVLESLVARTIRNIERSKVNVRLVGLSATLPNFEDVGTFLQVNPKKGLFHFDNSFRPVPLKQQYIGVAEVRSRMRIMNEIIYNKVIELAGSKQILVFVHSRKDTIITAQAIRNLCDLKGTLDLVLDADTGNGQILRDISKNAKHRELKDLLPNGFAIHHAGMSRQDRRLVEKLFSSGIVQVLVTTATLAWGVNLPAHTVIIKGTRLYKPERGGWVQIEALDVLQMMGRAGRPQFDSEGEGILMTDKSNLNHFLTLLTQQLPIESQMVSMLPDMLNAEIVLGTATNIDEAVDWLGYTFLYVRMLQAPTLYQISAHEAEEDPQRVTRRKELIHVAVAKLLNNKLIEYNYTTNALSSTELGRIASHFYVSCDTLTTYTERLNPVMSKSDIINAFSLSAEFKNMMSRPDERVLLDILRSKVPISISGSIFDSHVKVNILLQVHIFRLQLDGYALMTDKEYITQSAKRLMRAIYEILEHHGWSEAAGKALDLCNDIEGY